MSDLTQIHTAQMDTPSDNGMNFNTLLANYTPATHDQLEPHEHLLNLAQMLGSDKLLYIDENISIDGEFKPTADSIGVVLHRPDHRANNLAMFPLLDGQAGKPFLLTPFNNEVFIIGDGSEVIAVPDLETATNIYVGLDDGMTGYSLIVPPETHQFNSMVKAFAKQSQVTIPCDMLQRERYKRDFKTDNVRLVATIDPIEKLLLTTDMAGVLADGETIIDVLGGFVWGTPEPLADSNTKSTPYPFKAFTGVLCEAVEAIAHHAQVPPAMAGQCVLGALATISQQYINAPFSDEYIPVSLFLLTRGASTDGKNRTVRLSHQTVKNYQKEMDRKFREDFATWQADKRAVPRKDLENFLHGNPPPVQKTLFVSSGTLQGIVSEMLNNNQKSMTWVTADCGQFFGGYSMDDKNGSKTIADLSDVWSEGYLDSIIKGNQSQQAGNKRAYDLRFTLDLQGQDEIIRKPLADPIMNGQGFLPRFLFAFPDSMRGKRVYNTPERMNDNSDYDPRLQRYWQECNALLDPVPTKFKTDGEGNIIKINIAFADRQARQALANYQQSCENAIIKGGKYEKYPAYAGRMAENATRIASLMAFFEGRITLTADDIGRASLLTDYSMSERIRYDSENGGGDMAENDSQKLINWLVSKAKEKKTAKLNWSYIYHGCPKPMNKNSKAIKEVIEILESGYHVRMEKEGKATFIYINPSLLH